MKVLPTHDPKVELPLYPSAVDDDNEPPKQPLGITVWLRKRHGLLGTGFLLAVVLFYSMIKLANSHDDLEVVASKLRLGMRVNEIEELAGRPPTIIKGHPTWQSPTGASIVVEQVFGDRAGQITFCGPHKEGWINKTLQALRLQSKEPRRIVIHFDQRDW